MKQRRYRHSSWKQLALASGFNSMPPGGRSAVGASLPPREPTLTENFNVAVKKQENVSLFPRPASKLQIEELKKKLSQPRPSLELTPLGSVTKAYNPAADRKMSQTIRRMNATLECKKGNLKKPFNRASNGIGM